MFGLVKPQYILLLPYLKHTRIISVFSDTVHRAKISESLGIYMSLTTPASVN